MRRKNAVKRNNASPLATKKIIGTQLETLKPNNWKRKKQKLWRTDTKIQKQIVLHYGVFRK